MNHAEWRPIETAPKNFKILTWNGNEINIMEWSSALEKWEIEYSEFTFASPIHWMLLPEVPQ